MKAFAQSDNIIYNIWIKISNINPLWFRSKLYYISDFQLKYRFKICLILDLLEALSIRLPIFRKYILLLRHLLYFLFLINSESEVSITRIRQTTQCAYCNNKCNLTFCYTNIQWLRLEGTSGDHLVQSCYWEDDHPEQVDRHHVHSGYEYIQGWRFQNIPEGADQGCLFFFFSCFDRISYKMTKLLLANAVTTVNFLFF